MLIFVLGISFCGVFLLRVKETNTFKDFAGFLYGTGPNSNQGDSSTVELMKVNMPGRTGNNLRKQKLNDTRQFWKHKGFFTNKRKHDDKWARSNYTKECSKSRKFIVYRCYGGCGGFADRIKGMLNAYLWSLVTDRCLVLDLSHPCPNFLAHLLVPNKVKWNIGYPMPPDTITLDLHDIEYFGKTVIAHGELEKQYSSKVVILLSNVHYWSAFTIAQEYRQTLYQHGYQDFSPRGLFKKAFYEVFMWSETILEQYETLIGGVADLHVESGQNAAR